MRKGRSLKTVSSAWAVATFMEDNPDSQMILYQANGTIYRLGILEKGAQVNVPIGAIDGVRFCSQEQLVELALSANVSRETSSEA